MAKLNVTTLDLGLAGGKAGSFTAFSEWGASGTVAGFSTPGTTGLATVAAGGYSLTAAANAANITLIDAGSALKGWTINSSAVTGNVTVKGSDYNDSIKPGKGTVITGTGKDSIDITALTGDTTVTDYMYGSDVIVVSSVANPETLISTDGVIKGGTGTDKDLVLNATDGFYKATLTTNGTDAVNIWMGSTTAQNMDGSAETKELVMVAGTSSDTLIGGSKADNIYASTEGAYAFGGAGTDNIFVGNGASAEDKLRQYVAISSDSGKDSVQYFTTGFADTADVLVLRDGTVEDLKVSSYDANGTVIKNGGSVSIGGGAAWSLDGKNLKLMVQNSTGANSKVAFVNDSLAAGYALANADDTADYYISSGKVGKVSFANIGDDVVAELSNAGNYEDNATFKGIDSVVGGSGNSTLIGDGETKNYIKGGTGNSTIWGGGASNDTLVAGATGVDGFFVGLRDGKDTIVDFKTGVDAESDDVLYMLNSPAASLKNDGTNTTFTFTDGSTAVFKDRGNTVTGKDHAIRFSLDGTTIQTALVGKSTAGNSFQYSSDVDMFFGGSQTDTLKVEDTQYDGANVDIRLNNTLSQSYSSIEKVDASAYSGTAFLAGNDNVAEDLTGGQGKTTLWGGMGANDTLRGTTGDVTGFYFGKGNGADVILTSDSDDKVVFYDFANTDLTAIDNTGSQMKFTFNDGSSLQIQNYTSASVQTFEFTNGTWTYDKSTKTFTQTK